MSALLASHYLHLVLFALWLAALLAPDLASVPAAGLRRARLLARACLILSLPIGYGLARELAFVAIPGVLMRALWVFALVWLVAAAALLLVPSLPRRAILERGEFSLRVVLALGLAWDAVQGFRGTGHVLAPWLAAKFALLAVLFAVSLLEATRYAATARRAGALSLLLAAGFGVTRIWPGHS